MTSAIIHTGHPNQQPSFSMTQVITTFYKFVSIHDFEKKAGTLRDLCREKAIKGTIILACEGINGTIAGSPPAIEEVLSFLRCDPRLADLEHQQSPSKSPPFHRLKVRLKKEIVTMGMPDLVPQQGVGTYVSPQDWNALIADPQVLVIDTRNTYEVAIGSFQGATNPHTYSFREFPDYVRQQLSPTRHQKIAMFCTGGIRCEKASSFLLSQGFDQVYQLKGGIINYLEQISPEDSLWQGECFVFDQRIAVKQGLALGSYQMCPSCGHPIQIINRKSNSFTMI